MYLFCIVFIFVFVFVFVFVFDDKLCVRYLIDIGADVNRKSVKGNTALHDCAESGSLEIMKLLIGSGARWDFQKIVTIGHFPELSPDLMIMEETDFPLQGVGNSICCSFPDFQLEDFQQ